MPSTFTTSNRLEKQAPGENVDSWATKLNGNMIDLTDDALDGMVSFALSGSKSLTTANEAVDEARCRFLNITGGSGGTVTIPNLEKWYIVYNGSSADVTFTTGTGTSAAVATGLLKIITCDGANVVRQSSGPAFGSAPISTTGTLASGAQTVTGSVQTTDGIGITKNTNSDFNGLIVANSNSGSSSATRMRTNADTAQLVMTSWGTSVATFGGKNTIEGVGDIVIRPNGTPAIHALSASGCYFPNHTTTASAANAFLNSGSTPVGQLARSTSSEWYKTGIEDVEQKYLDAALSIRAVYYRSNPEHVPNDNPAFGHWGHIAEEVAAIDPRLVHWGYQERDYETYTFELPASVETGELDDDGNPVTETVMQPQEGKRLKKDAELRPDGAQYERINVLKIEALRRQVADLQAAVAALQAA